MTIDGTGLTVVMFWITHFAEFYPESMMVKIRKRSQTAKILLKIIFHPVSQKRELSFLLVNTPGLWNMPGKISTRFIKNIYLVSIFINLILLMQSLFCG